MFSVRITHFQWLGTEGRPIPDQSRSIGPFTSARPSSRPAPATLTGLNPIGLIAALSEQCTSDCNQQAQNNYTWRSVNDNTLIRHQGPLDGLQLHIEQSWLNIVRRSEHCQNKGTKLVVCHPGPINVVPRFPFLKRNYKRPPTVLLAPMGQRKRFPEDKLVSTGPRLAASIVRLRNSSARLFAVGWIVKFLFLKKSQLQTWNHFTFTELVQCESHFSL